MAFDWGTLFTSLLGGAGVGMQAMTSYNNAKAQNAAADWNAKIAEQNALDYDALAGQAREVGRKNADDLRLSVDNTIGEQRAATSASGVKVDVGSSADAQASTRAMGEYDAQTLLYNAEIEAQAMERQARNERTGAAMTRATKQNPYVSAGTTLLTGTTTLMNTYNNTAIAQKTWEKR